MFSNADRPAARRPSAGGKFSGGGGMGGMGAGGPGEGISSGGGFPGRPGGRPGAGLGRPGGGPAGGMGGAIASDPENDNYLRNGSELYPYIEALTEKDVTEDYRVARFFDLDTEAGKTYEYRMRVWLADPNHEDPDNLFAMERGGSLTSGNRDGGPGRGTGWRLARHGSARQSRPRFQSRRRARAGSQGRQPGS